MVNRTTTIPHQKSKKPLGTERRTATLHSSSLPSRSALCVSGFTFLLSSLTIISLLYVATCPVAQKIAGEKIERTFIVKQYASGGREMGSIGKRAIEWNGNISIDRILFRFCSSDLFIPFHRQHEPSLILDHLATVRMVC